MARNEPYRHARKIPCASQTSVWLFILFWATIANGQAADTLRASFALCDTGRRMTCVVDGDTFWLDGVKIRIADIDAPEISQPACREERVAGEAAKLRLLQMLNAGEFSLTLAYGTKTLMAETCVLFRAQTRRSASCSCGKDLLDDGVTLVGIGVAPTCTNGSPACIRSSAVGRGSSPESAETALRVW